MAEYTHNLGLRCPAELDAYAVADFNANARLVDEAFARLRYDITAIAEQLNTGFTGISENWQFTADDMDNWTGYDGTGLPEGIYDQAGSRMYVQGVE